MVESALSGLQRALSGGTVRRKTSNAVDLERDDHVLDQYKPNPRFKPYTNIFKNLLKMESR